MQSAAAITLGVGTQTDVERWAGLRPMTPDSRPIIGASQVGGPFLNTGQGILGRTLACGSARLRADLIDGKAPLCPAEPLSIARFS